MLTCFDASPFSPFSRSFDNILFCHSVLEPADIRLGARLRLEAWNDPVLDSEIDGLLQGLPCVDIWTPLSDR
jgi:hypothetical protein